METNEVDWHYREQEYMNLLHAMQSGVKAVMEYEGNQGSAATSPKHLRVGINSAMIELGAIVKTLVEAEIISYETYRDNSIYILELEKANYEKQLKHYTGVDIKLG